MFGSKYSDTNFWWSWKIWRRATLRRADSPRGSTGRIPWASTVNSCSYSFSPALPLRAHFRAWQCLDDDQERTAFLIISTMFTRACSCPILPKPAWTDAAMHENKEHGNRVLTVAIGWSRSWRTLALAGWQLAAVLVFLTFVVQREGVDPSVSAIAFTRSIFQLRSRIYELRLDG